MMRFMKKRGTPQKPSPPPTARVISLLSPGKDAVVLDFSKDEKTLEESTFKAYRDPSVMSVSLWLRLQMGFDKRDSSLKFLTESEEPELDTLTFKAHLEECGRDRLKAERKLPPVLRQYRRTRALNRDDKTPRFAARRSVLRGRAGSEPKQILHFDENHRPAFIGATSRRSCNITGRRPLAKDAELNYEVDSEDEWEEEAEDGESLSDVEVEKETAREDAELLLLYGSDDESDDDDFLDDEDAEDDGDEEDDEDSVVEIVSECTTNTNAPSAPRPPSNESKLSSNTLEDEQKKAVINVDVWQPSKKRPASASKEELAGSKKKRRRKNNSLNYVRVEVLGIDYGDSDEPSLLDAFPVSTYLDAPSFTPFDALKDSTNTQRNQTKNSLKTSQQTPRPNSKLSVLDGNAIFELAAMVHGSRLGKDKLVHQFLHMRRSRELPVPTQSEVHRLLGQLTVREKRERDTRAFLYLRDRNLEVHVNAARVRNASIASNAQGPQRPNAPVVNNAVSLPVANSSRSITQCLDTTFAAQPLVATVHSTEARLITSIIDRTALQMQQKAPMVISSPVIGGATVGQASGSNAMSSSN